MQAPFCDKFEKAKTTAHENREEEKAPRLNVRKNEPRPLFPPAIIRLARPAPFSPIDYIPACRSGFPKIRSSTSPAGH